MYYISCYLYMFHYHLTRVLLSYVLILFQLEYLLITFINTFSPILYDNVCIFDTSMLSYHLGKHFVLPLKQQYIWQLHICTICSCTLLFNYVIPILYDTVCIFRYDISVVTFRDNRLFNIWTHRSFKYIYKLGIIITFE